jgi:uncharacterized membrane protein YfcA
MEIIGYILSILIGVSLGLIGGGGSILTIPVLIYLFKVEPVVATSYSLFIVGLTSTIGSVEYFKKGLIHTKTALAFGIPTILSVFITRAYILPSIPSEVLSIGTVIITKRILIMILFSVLMILASYSMIKSKKEKVTSKIQDKKINYAIIFTEGIAVGFLTGIVGAGGGFLIIPSLVLISKLNMKEAIGTSLAIISLNSLIGFFGEMIVRGTVTEISWLFLLSITVFAIVGIFIGLKLSRKIEGAKLKPAFGWFVLVMGIYILLKETAFA